MLRNKRVLPFVALALVVTLALGAGLSAAAANAISQDEIAGIIETTTDKSLIESPLLNVANAAKESVVGVNNYQIRGSISSFDFGYGFRYRQPMDEAPRLRGTGSGVVVTSYGHVLTNQHVVDGAEKITVTFGETELDATLISSDENLDLAVLLVPGIQLPAAPLGDSDALQIGEYAIVIGNPLGSQFERSVTLGVVSSVSRTMLSSNRDRFGLRVNNENQMIQVDAAISSGNSGGGMFNTLGQLQGVPTLKFDSNFFSQTSVDNIGMCIPINAAKPMIKAALEQYDAEEAQQQAAAQPTQESAEAVIPAGQNTPRIGVQIFSLPSNYLPVAQGILPQGAYVAEVEPDSPASAAGLEVGDIVVEAAGQVIRDADGLVNIIRQQQAGASLSIKIYRVPGLDAVLEDAEGINRLEKGTYLDLTVTPQIIRDAAGL